LWAQRAGQRPRQELQCRSTKALKEIHAITDEWK
jgi:hypothetical protein